MCRLSILILLLQLGCTSSAHQLSPQYQQERSNRQPLQKSSVVLRSPDKYEKQELEGGKELDPRPRIVEIDQNAGKYELQWIGSDGKKKIIAYQRADAINAVVEARVERGPDGKFVFLYVVRNLPDSPTYLSSFTVQTFTNDVMVSEVSDLYIGQMSRYLREFKVGQWWRFAILGETSPRMEPGMSMEFSLTSSALPGIVGCRATAGDSTLKGVGEEMPMELADAIPGYEEWARGYTIGPVDSLAVLNETEKARYISDNMPKFLEAGWLSEETARKYEGMLKGGALKPAVAEAARDFKQGFITSELFHIIDGLGR